MQARGSARLACYVHKVSSLPATALLGFLKSNEVWPRSIMGISMLIWI